MCNSRPLNGYFLIDGHVISVILHIQIIIELFQCFRCQGFSLFHHLMSQKLKFRKHGLTVQRGSELLQKIIDKISLFLFICGMIQMVHQQRLIAGGSHLCHKYFIITVKHIVIFCRIPGMQCMSHFMGKGKF